MKKTCNLQVAIENLYKVFFCYKFLPDFAERCCPCCGPSKRQVEELYRPLREINGDDLEGYCFKAMTTWGNENDFKYFLPRILELGAYDLLVGKLEYANFINWPSEEITSVLDFSDKNFYIYLV